MRLKKTVMILVTCAILGLVISPMAAQDEGLIVVASKSTYQGAQRWVDFLTKEGIDLKNVVPAEFNKHQNEEFIVLMGGMNEPGIKDLVKKAVGNKEAAALTKKGAKNMYVRSNVWGPGQNVLIFAGADVAAAEKVRKDNKEEWFEIIAEWFELETGGPRLGGY